MIQRTVSPEKGLRVGTGDSFSSIVSKKFLLMVLPSVTLGNVQFMLPDCDSVASIYPVISKTSGKIENFSQFSISI